jgi:hypothetical protein
MTHYCQLLRKFFIVWAYSLNNKIPFYLGLLDVLLNVKAQVFQGEFLKNADKALYETKNTRQRQSRII